MSKKKQSLQERIEEARKRRKLPPREGHELTADAKETRTPARGDFFDALKKVSKPEQK